MTEKNENLCNVLGENMNDYACYFQVIINQKSVDGVDLDEHRLDEICRDISAKLLEKYPQHGVFVKGFIKVE